MRHRQHSWGRVRWDWNPLLFQVVSMQFLYGWKGQLFFEPLGVSRKPSSHLVWWRSGWSHWYHHFCMKVTRFSLFFATFCWFRLFSPSGFCCFTSSKGFLVSEEPFAFAFALALQRTRVAGLGLEDWSAEYRVESTSWGRGSRIFGGKKTRKDGR